MKKLIILSLLTLLAIVPAAAKKKQAPQLTDRQYWCQEAWRMAQPVLENMAKGELQKNMKTEFSPSFDNRNRKVVYMETFGRLMAGIAPWLSLAETKAPSSPSEGGTTDPKTRKTKEAPSGAVGGASGASLSEAEMVAQLLAASGAALLRGRSPRSRVLNLSV